MRYNGQRTRTAKSIAEGKMTEQTAPKPRDLMAMDVFGVRVHVSTTDVEALMRVTALAAVALHERPELLTRLDAVDRDRARLRKLLIAAQQACQTAIAELDPKDEG